MRACSRLKPLLQQDTLFLKKPEIKILRCIQVRIIAAIR